MPWAAVGAAVAGAATTHVLSGGGGGGGGEAAGAADPFAGQRWQYQDMLQKMMQPGGFTPQDPSYNWRFSQGQQALERSMGASGMLNSGNRLAALTDYGQGQASTEYANQFSRLSQLAGANVGSPAAAAQIMSNENSAFQSAIAPVGSAIGKGVVGWGKSLYDNWGSGGGGGGGLDFSGTMFT